MCKQVAFVITREIKHAANSSAVQVGGIRIFIGYIKLTCTHDVMTVHQFDGMATHHPAVAV